MKQNCDDLFPLSPTPSEASDGAVTEAHGGGNPERQEHNCSSISQIV